MAKFSIAIGFPPPICHAIDAQWHGYPITGIQSSVGKTLAIACEQAHVGAEARIGAQAQAPVTLFRCLFTRLLPTGSALFFAAHACVSKVSPFTEYDSNCKFCPKTVTSVGSKGRAYKLQTEVKPAGQAKQNAPLPPPPLLREKLGSSTGCEPNTVRQGLGQRFFDNIWSCTKILCLLGLNFYF